MRTERRLCAWDPGGLSFWVQVQGATLAMGRLPFEVGPLGPYAEQVGSPLRELAKAQAEAWTRRGELPKGLELPKERERWTS